MVDCKVFFNHHIRPFGSSALVRSHQERRWLFEEPTQSHLSILQYTKINTFAGEQLTQDLSDALGNSLEALSLMFDRAEVKLSTHYYQHKCLLYAITINLL